MEKDGGEGAIVVAGEAQTRMVGVQGSQWLTVEGRS
jgi:hypothetical protein